MQLPVTVDPLEGMKLYRQFIVYKVVPRENGKTDKLPINPLTGLTSNAHDSQIWLDYDAAKGIAAIWGSDFGYGFVFTDADPFWFLDVDGARVGDGWNQIAIALHSSLPGCAVELSRSGDGLHFYGTGVAPSHSCKNKELGLEFYHTGRFAALTENGLAGNCLTDMSHILPALVTAYFPPATERSDAEWGDGPDSEWAGPEDDAELIRRMMNAQSASSAFSGKASFADLWLANEPALARTYPDAQGKKPWDESGADMALAQHLAFWTGKDHERIERLMWLSKLARDKWETHRSYLRELTITRAVARQVEVYNDGSKALVSVEVATVAPAVPAPVQRTGDGFLTPTQQAALFAGCVIIEPEVRALVPTGEILRPESFRIRYGGSQYAMDGRNEKTTKDAWEAFTQSQVISYPTVTGGTIFAPREPFGKILWRGGQTFVNTWFPIEVSRQPGDVEPFLVHLRKVFPNERDRAIFMAYMAACVQYQGIKFQWAPLIQGVEGNGKTLFTRCVTAAIGERYSHMPPAAELGEKFNAWLFGKTFIGVEDVYVPDNKKGIFEILKPMLTSERLARREMRMDQQMADSCANFIFNTNHKDGLLKTDNDRRICVMFTGQQSVSDLTRDGMNGQYFPDLYRWLREDGGYAMVTDFIYRYEIPAEFNPAGDCQRAPVTSTTGEAIQASMGGFEQDVMEMIAQGEPGFCGDFISSVMMDRAIVDRKINTRLGQNKRRDALKSLGYVAHPALHEGRTTRNVLPDDKKPRLYVKLQSLKTQIGSCEEVAVQYETANNTIWNRGIQRAK